MRLAYRRNPEHPKTNVRLPHLHSSPNPAHTKNHYQPTTTPTNMRRSRDPLPPGHGRYLRTMQHHTYTSHGRRQSITSYPVNPRIDTHPYYQSSPQRNVSLQAYPNLSNTQSTEYPYMSPMRQQQQQQQQQDAFQGQGQRRSMGMTHSFSAPWDGYRGSQSKPPTPRPQQRSGRKSNVRPSMQDAVRVSAPQDLDGDVFDDDYETCVDVSWSRNHVVAAPLPLPSFLTSISSPSQSTKSW